MLRGYEVHLAGKKIRANQHVCAFFNSREDEYSVMLPFLREGLDHGDRCFGIVDPVHRAAHLERLGAAGIAVEEAESRGYLEVRPWQDAYLLDGRFDLERMISLCKALFKENRARGYPLTRLWANMEWGLEDVPGVHDIVAYESRLNAEMASFEGVVGVCTYDVSKFNAATVMDILRTHPMVILGPVLQENPFYTPHEEFMRELDERRGAPHGNSRKFASERVAS